MLAKDQLGERSLGRRAIRVGLVMDGSRRHYDVAKALHAFGSLETMYCDAYTSPRSFQRFAAGLLKRVSPSLGKKFLERFTSDIPASKTRSNSFLVLRAVLAKNRFTTQEEYWQWLSKKTKEWIVREGFGECNSLYGFIRNMDPELCKIALNTGLTVLGEQMIAPAAIEKLEAESQQERWPGWELPSLSGSFSRVEDIERATWEKTTRIVAPSSYVANGLASQGVSLEKIDLVPYPAEFASLRYVDRSDRNTTLTVGFVGQINLRKNAPVFLQIAKRMHNDNLRFVMVGKNYLAHKIIMDYSPYVTFTGPIPRSDVASKLYGFDLFFFPSTCEGSAGVVLEAMATGLPVITTPNSGTLIEDGVDGFVCNPDEIEVFIDRIEKLLADKAMRIRFGVAAAEKVKGLTLENYGTELVASFRESMPLA